MMHTCPTLYTDRLVIRPISIADHIDFFKLLTNPVISEIAGVESNLELKHIHESIQYFRH